MILKKFKRWKQEEEWIMELRKLSDKELLDIGITRQNLEKEIKKIKKGVKE